MTISAADPQSPVKAANVVWHDVSVTRQDREHLNTHRSLFLWFTGLSGSGKSTLSHAVGRRLHDMGMRTYVMDGDNVRHGLCSDLGFSPQDRQENIRRIGEVGKLFTDAGMIVLAAFISPFRVDRQRVRNIVEPGDFIEIHCKCPIDLCASRDTKGLYKRARAGEIKDFTGISSPYEEPVDPELVVYSGRDPIDMCVQKVVDFVLQRVKLEDNSSPG